MIDPRGLTLLQWADATILALEPTWGVGKLIDERSWQDWATQLYRAAPFVGRELPDPYQFTDWSEWAMRAYPMLESVTS